MGGDPLLQKDILGKEETIGELNSFEGNSFSYKTYAGSNKNCANSDKTYAGSNKNCADSDKTYAGIAFFVPKI